MTTGKGVSSAAEDGTTDETIVFDGSLAMVSVLFVAPLANVCC